MSDAASRILFRNARVWDGTGAASFPADVLIENDRIRTVARSLGQLDPAGAEVVDAGGMTLMPGMVEGHAHITFINAPRPTDLGDTPPEEHTLIAARNARLLLDSGFTGAYSAASAKLRIETLSMLAICPVPVCVPVGRKSPSPAAWATSAKHTNSAIVSPSSPMGRWK